MDVSSTRRGESTARTSTPSQSSSSGGARRSSTPTQNSSIFNNSSSRRSVTDRREPHGAHHHNAGPKHEPYHDITKHGYNNGPIMAKQSFFGRMFGHHRGPEGHHEHHGHNGRPHMPERQSFMQRLTGFFRR